MCTHNNTLFPEPAITTTGWHNTMIRVYKNLRFPWIHNRDPSACHSLNNPSSVNQVPVPVWRRPATRLWLYHASGGDSHWRILSIRVNPVIMKSTCIRACDADQTLFTFFFFEGLFDMFLRGYDSCPSRRNPKRHVPTMHLILTSGRVFSPKISQLESQIFLRYVARLPPMVAFRNCMSS